MENQLNKFTPQDYVDWMADVINAEKTRLHDLGGWDYKLCQERIKAYEYAMRCFEILSHPTIDIKEFI